MQQKIRLKIYFLVFCIFLMAPSPAMAEFSCVEGLQDSGSIYRVCMPPDELYNGKLAIWAHGFQDATEEVFQKTS